MNASVPAPSEVPRVDESGAPRPLVFVRGWDRTRYELSPASVDGGFDATDLAAAREAFSYRAGVAEHEVHPRLLELAYKAMLHFGKDEVRLTSGFRPTRIRSRHTHGRAMDILLPGVDFRQLAAFMRQQGFVGVGVYPRSGFVHVDVRSSSYFWVDYARPGRRGRVRPIMMDSAARADAEARARGELPDTDVAAAEEEEEEVAEQTRQARRERQRATRLVGRANRRIRAAAAAANRRG